MTYRKEAIAQIHSIRNGMGLDRENFPDSLKGSIARTLWNDSTFTYGMEYGAILILMELFDIKEEELK